MTIDMILLAAFVIGAVWTMMATRLLYSVVALAFTSAILTILMFRLDSPLAAVFELSVCAGLVSAVFISTISLTKRVSPEELVVRRKERLSLFWLLPIMVILAGIALSQVHLPIDFNLPQPKNNDVRIILWNLRHLDLLGQIVILLGGAFGVVTLFKEWKNE